MRMIYVVALASAFLALSAATALRPDRRGLFATLAYPVGWAAGELAGQGLVLEGGLVVLLWWWGWPRDHWLDGVVIALALTVVAENLALIAILFHSRRVVRRAMAESPERPLEIPRPRDDRFGSWWRTALQVPLHPRAMQLTRNVVYGPLERHRLDVWRLSTSPDGAPVIVYLHGGAWTFGDKREQGRPMLHEFVARGWVVVAINYRLAPQNPWPAQIEDATRALGWVKQHVAAYGGDPERVVIAGASAGGQMAALLALTASDSTWRPSDVTGVRDWSVRGALTFYGVLEMTGDEDHWRGLGRGLRVLLEHRVVKVPFDGHESTYEAMSPYARLGVDAPPFLVVQGGNDTLVEVNVARDFVEKFRHVAVAPIYYVELPFTQHAYDVTASPRTSATTRAAVAFAQSVVRARPTPNATLLANYQVPPSELAVEVETSAWLEAREAAARLGPLWVVTSDNPFSATLSPDENAARRLELRHSLERRDIAFVASRCSDASGEWPDEYGVALLDVSEDVARALARAWDQYAYYAVSATTVDVRLASDDVSV